MRTFYFLLFFIFLPGSVWADSDTRSIRVDQTINISHLQDEDLLAADFGPSTQDIARRRSPKFSIVLKPHTADAIVDLQCDYFDGTTTTNSNILVKGGIAVPAKTGFDFDWVLDYRDENCNLQAISGGTQFWTVIIKKSYDSGR